MRTARVLIVDDSATIRRLLADILAGDPEIEVVGAAANGAAALEKIRELRPDVITLDVEMPGVSGLDLLVEIRRASPRLPVIMFSSLTQRAASTTLDALARGATDYVTKPSGEGGREAAAEHVRSHLVPKLKALVLPARPPAVAPRPKEPAAAVVPPTTTTIAHGAPRRAVDVLAIGASTGGPNALSALFGALPRGLSVPVVIVQHMPPLFTQILAERLTATSGHPVSEAKDGDALAPGRVLIAPGDQHVRLTLDGATVRVTLDRGPKENSCRPSVDVLFRSVASVFGGRSLAVILTGMGQDGLRGAELIHAAGGQILAQDEATSVVWGMPGSVAHAGIADEILPLEDMARGVLRRLALPSSDLSAHLG